MRYWDDGPTMLSQMHLMEFARRCRFLSQHMLDLRIAREPRVMAADLEERAREAKLAADACVPAGVQHYAPR